MAYMDFDIDQEALTKKDHHYEVPVFLILWFSCTRKGNQA